MAQSPKTRTRSQRVASVELPKGRLSAMLANLRRGRVLLRLALCGLSAVAMLLITRAWDPPRDFRTDRVVNRDISVRTPFAIEDPEATEAKRMNQRRLAVAVYDHNKAPLEVLRAEIKNEVSRLVGYDSFEDADKNLWESFDYDMAENAPELTQEEQQAEFEQFKQALSEEGAMDAFKKAIDEVFSPLEQHGLLRELSEGHDANPERIAVRPVGTTDYETIYPLSEVRLEDVVNRLQIQLPQKIPSLVVANRVFERLKDRLPSALTLRLNREATNAAQDLAAEEVEPVKIFFERGDLIARAGSPLGEEEV
ncbi:MAG: hypothetical protein KDA37_06320, partial [Planctomycetales bacterium]|nr:hypothetical protein [Planctomycetales bacterium]